jgi:hypothetical protein
MVKNEDNGLSSAYAMSERAGGQCEYAKYQGTATVTSITYLPDQQRYKIMFSFVPNQKIQHAWVNTEGREYVLTLTNGQHPGREFMEKYQINVGGRYRCILEAITKGTCTPMIFKFPGMRLDAY